MNRLRNRLILVFVVATLAPLLIIGWLSVSLLRYSLSLSSTQQLDQISQSLQKTGRELYQRARQSLEKGAASGTIPPQRFEADERVKWPIAVQEFFATGEESAVVPSRDRDRLDYFVRHGDAVWAYSTSLHGVSLRQLSDQYTAARAQVASATSHNWRRGFTYTYLLLAASIWVAPLLALIYFAHRVSRPIQRLTTGLSQVAAGHLDYRVLPGRNDEVGAAIHAFNEMADQLQQSQARLVYMTRLESWQALARKMAHEVKNSLTPIRLTMEEIAARQSGQDGEFYQQAAQIVVDEVLSLERRVRAFSEFSSEPPISPKAIDINSLLEERIAFLKPAHPGVHYDLRLAPDQPTLVADEDLIKGVLTNLLENAAQAVEPGGTVLGVTASDSGKVAIEVHDSGPGLSQQARNTLFEPAISFKRGGMGLGLSIARKSARLLGGDIRLVPGELGGAAFRVSLPSA